MKFLSSFIAISIASTLLVSAEDPPLIPVPAPDGKALPDQAPPLAEEPKTNLEFLIRADEVVARIRNNKRQLDPFGMPMDPTNMIETPNLSEQYGELEEIPTLNNSSLKTALNTLPISGVYPKKGKIVLGARSFNQGDVFGMKLEELTIKLRFEGIKGHSIYFKDLDTQEVATVEYNTRPKEFEPITASSKPAPVKGMQRMEDLFIVN